MRGAGAGVRPRCRLGSHPWRSPRMVCVRACMCVRVCVCVRARARVCDINSGADPARGDVAACGAAAVPAPALARTLNVAGPYGMGAADVPSVPPPLHGRVRAPAREQPAVQARLSLSPSLPCPISLLLPIFQRGWRLSLHTCGARCRFVSAPAGLSLFAAVRRFSEEGGLTHRAGQQGDACDSSIRDLRRKTADALQPPAGAADGEERPTELALALTDAPVGDRSLLRSMSRDHSAVCRALAAATGQTIRVLAFGPLPRPTVGCADGAAGDWAQAEDLLCAEANAAAEDPLVPHWTEFAPPAAPGKDAGAPAAGEDRAAFTPASSAGGASGLCLLHLFDHHFDLLAPAAPADDKSGAGDTVKSRQNAPSPWFLNHADALWRTRPPIMLAAMDGTP